MPPSKFAATARKSQQSRRALLIKARLARQQLKAAASTTQTPPVSPPPSSPPSPPSRSSPVAVPDSASKRKLSSYGDISYDESTDSVSYVLIDMSAMQQLFATLLCPTCKTASLTVAHREQAHMGMAVELTVGCTLCHEDISECTSSQRTLSSKKFDINRRISLAFTAVGLGHAGLASFCEVMGMRSISKSTFQDHKMELETAASVAKSKLLAETHLIVREAYLSSGMTATDDDDIINVCVSYDGSWHKRGFTSHHGVGCVIDSVTGLVVDYEAVSRYCQVCSTSGDKLKSSPSEYDEWWETHKNVCGVNHQGSSGLMEVTAAKILWQRSLEFKMRYTTMISDGDSKTYTELLSLAPYGKDHLVKKEECINHFSKRLGTALRKVVASEKAKGVTLGGVKHGSLTQNKMGLMQTYFTRAILANSSSVAAMRSAIWAIYFHAYSSDESPQHHFCPSGRDSWCPYQKAIAFNCPPPKHKSSIQLSERVASYIKPVFERLSADELLGRCLQGKTQNPNESVHSVIWNFIPKSRFVGIKRIQIGLYLGAGQFNSGAHSLHQLMKAAGLQVNSITRHHGSIRNEERIAQSQKAALETTKRRREVRRQAQARALASMETTEGGPAYASGAF